MNTTQLIAGAVDKLVTFRDDLRPPKVVFGRCCLTGEWGKCIAIDVGDVSVQMPNTEKGIDYDPETGEVRFNLWKPLIIQNQVTFSESGLKKLLAYMESQDNPIPGVCPDLVYKWQVSYDDGTGISQFMTKEDGSDEEIRSSDIEFARVKQLSIVARYGDDSTLPNYTFVKETGKIYKSGQELDLVYDGAYIPDSEIIYARKVTHVYESHIVNLSREITGAHTGVLQLLGWKVGGLQGPGPGLIIAIDERGTWRPWEYIE